MKIHGFGAATTSPAGEGLYPDNIPTSVAMLKAWFAGLPAGCTDVACWPLPPMTDVELAGSGGVPPPWEKIPLFEWDGLPIEIECGGVAYAGLGAR